MAKFRNIKNSFVAGEVSPSVLGRTDLTQYQHACKRLKNMIPMLSGGAYRRPGTQFVRADDSDSYQAPFFMPFTGSDLRRFMLAFNKGSVTNSGTNRIIPFHNFLNFQVSNDTAVTLTENFPYGSDEMAYVRVAQLGEVMWLVHPKYPPMILKRTHAALDNTNSNTFKLRQFDAENFDGTNFTGAQRRDAWPYRPQNASATTITPSATTGVGVTFTASTAIFNASHVGSMWKINHAGTVGAFLIFTFVSATVVTGTVIQTLGATGAVSTWWEPAWSNFRGWPSAVTLFDKRLVMAGSPAQPDSLWFTEQDSFQQFSKDVIVDPSSGTGSDITEPFTATLATPYVARITWLKTGDKLLVGTQRAEWFIDRILTSTGFGPGNAGATHQSDFGSNGTICEVGNEVFFVSRDGLTIRSLVFSVYDNTYVAESPQVFYPDFPYACDNTLDFNGVRGVKQMAWDDSRKTLWCLDWNGNLRGMTHDRKLSITAWHTQELGGYDATVFPGGYNGNGAGVHHGLDGTDITQFPCSGAIMAFALVQNDTTDVVEIWLSVRRYINSHWYSFIERMIGGIPATNTVKRPMLISESTWTDATTWYGSQLTGWNLAYLTGASVVGNASSIAHGLFALPAVVVPGGGAVADINFGANTLTDWASTDPLIEYSVMFGLPFTPIIEPVTPNAGSIIGDAVGGVQRPTKAIVRFDRTMHAQIGQTQARLQTIDFRTPTTPMGDSQEMFSGLKEVSLEANYVRDGALVITQNAPLPMTVVSIVTEGLCYD